MSNVRLGQLSNVDPSLISRYRRGKSIPAKNRETMQWICRVLYNRIHSQDLLPALSEITALPVELLTSKDGQEAFLKWLLEAPDADTQAVGGILSDLENFSSLKSCMEKFTEIRSM